MYKPFKQTFKFSLVTGIGIRMIVAIYITIDISILSELNWAKIFTKNAVILLIVFLSLEVAHSIDLILLWFDFLIDLI